MEHGVKKDANAYKLIIDENSIKEGVYIDVNLPYPLPLEAKNLEVVNDSLVLKDIGVKIAADISKNRIKAKANEIDPIFEFKDNYSLRKYRRFLFINKYDSNYWELKIIYKKRGKIYYIQSYDREIIDDIEEITKVERIKNSSGQEKYLLNPDKKEFKKIMKLDIFDNKFVFEK